MHFLNQPIFRSGWTAWVHGHPCRYGNSPCTPTAAAGRNSSWAGLGSTMLLGWDMALHTLLLPETLLALGECHHELTTWCQPVPATYPGVLIQPWPILPRMDQGLHGGCPREQGYVLLQSCAGPAGHHWHLGVPQCFPAASGERRAPAPPPRAWDPGTYAAFSRRRNTTCSASCSAPGREGGEPITPVPPSVSPQPPAPS